MGKISGMQRYAEQFAQAKVEAAQRLISQYMIDTHLECAKLSLCQNVKRRMMEKMQEFVVHGDGDKKPVGISRAEPSADD